MPTPKKVPRHPRRSGKGSVAVYMPGMGRDVFKGDIVLHPTERVVMIQVPGPAARTIMACFENCIVYFDED